jgi:hypothetical protein
MSNLSLRSGTAEAAKESDGGASQPAPGKQTLTESLGGEAAAAAPAPRAPTAIKAAEGSESIAPAPRGELAGDGGPDEGDFGGAATTMSTTDWSGQSASWMDHGQFNWWIKWATDGTAGWIVQKITNTLAGTAKNGSAISLSTYGIVPTYYEAWEVDKDGNITGSLGATPNRDKWTRGSRGDGSKGTWSMTGNVYWTPTDPAKSGFTSGGVVNAGSLLASTSAPKDLSAELLTRSANGAWDSTGSTKTHTGKAK